jgi:AcrR family transcriptional regulator
VPKLAKNPRIDVRGIRREQIVEAAVAVIAERGLQNLSLSEIEKKAGMSRGQLTYYFPAKEDILLAVFDHLLQLMYQAIGKADIERSAQLASWEMLEAVLRRAIGGQASVGLDFEVLQYTFLSQIGHREDFRHRLATLYEEWREALAESLQEQTGSKSGKLPASPRAIATLILALLHGLGMQAAADPNAFDRDEMVDLCLHLFGTFLRPKVARS